MPIQIDLAPRGALRNEIIAAISAVVDGGKYILDRTVIEFERQWAEYVGAKYCVGVGNGFDALQLALRAYDVGPGDRVGVSGMTCWPTWGAIETVGAIPIMDSIDAKVVVPVILYGIPEIQDVLLRAIHNGYILMDCAQAHGARWAGKPISSYSDCAAWSFYPTKNLGAMGDAGAITTDDFSLMEKLRGMRRYNDGINSCLDPIQAAVLLVKLKYLDNWNHIRAWQAGIYTRELDDLVALPYVAPEAQPCWHQFSIYTERRDELKAFLQGRGIDTLIHYPQPPYKMSAHTANELHPTIDEWARTELSLPIGPCFTDKEIKTVISTVKEFFNV